jgi:glycosyltransferase involved in cell wall biosynthesis
MRPPDRLLATLMEHRDIGRLLVANPPRSAPARLLRAVAGRGDAPFPADARHRLHTPLRLRRSDPASLQGLRKTYERYDESLRQAARKLGLQEPAVITTNPLVAGFCPLEWAGGVTFYARDDWSVYTPRRQYWAGYLEAYRKIQESGRAVVAVSEQIIDKIQPSGLHAVVANGVEPAEWQGPRPPEPKWLAGIPHPRALYVGTLDTRLDVEGLECLAAARPDLQVILLGHQDRTLPGYLDPLRSSANVHIMPAVGRQSLVAAIRNVDICLLSHRRTELTAAMSPLKVYEYLAGGCPVISVDLPPVRSIRGRMILVDTVADFAEVVDDALALGLAPEAERLAFIAANSWRSRHESIIKIALAARKRPAVSEPAAFSSGRAFAGGVS